MQPVQSLSFLLFSSCINLCFAAPAAIPVAAPAPTPAPSLEDVERRGLLGAVVGDVASNVNGAVLSDLNNIGNAAPTATNDADIFAKILTDFELVVQTQFPIAVSAASRTLSGILTNPTPSNVFVLAADLVAAGLTSNNVADALNFVKGELTGENCDENNNPRNPSPAIYPKASWKDAPYSLSEAQLRAAIYIPSTFKYGAKGAPQPVILIPGTGDTGYTTFIGNFIPLLQQNNKVADPVWLNIPFYLNDNAQVNAEYVAYAINYISGISGGSKIAIAGWSQGNIDAQWAFKYWSSTRSKVTDHVAMSPDYHGTILANFIATPDIPLPQAYLQQEYYSNFITTLRANGGDSAYVPTTTIYSGLLDEIVEPQQGTNASAYLLDARHVGVTNNEVQSVCPGQPAGSFYTHEGVLYNPISWALFVDALSHSGPGQVSRINKNAICGEYLTAGLDLTDFLLTENSILLAVLTFLADPWKSIFEAPIMPYAQSGKPIY